MHRERVSSVSKRQQYHSQRFNEKPAINPIKKRMDIPQQHLIPHELIIGNGAIFEDDYNYRLIQVIWAHPNLVQGRTSIKWTKKSRIHENGTVKEKDTMYYEIVLHEGKKENEKPLLLYVFIYISWTVKQQVREILRWLEVSNNDEKELILSALSN